MTTLIKCHHLAGVTALFDELDQCVDQIAANGAAQAAGSHFEYVVIGGFHQQVIEANFAELVDDDGHAGHGRIGQQPVEQGGLAGAEEAGQHRDGYRHELAVSVLLMAAH